MNYLFWAECFLKYKINKHKFKSNQTRCLQTGLIYLHPYDKAEEEMTTSHIVSKMILFFYDYYLDIIIIIII